MDYKLIDYLDCLNRTTGVDEAWTAITQFMSGFGFDYMVYAYGEDRDTPDFPNLISKTPEGWLHHYEKQGYVVHDPVYDHCAHSLRPLLIGRKYLEVRQKSRAIDTLLDESNDAGLREGLAIPIRTTDTNGIGSIGVFADLSTDEFERVYSEHSELLHLAALYAHMHLQYLIRKSVRESIKLTPRQLELLHWLADGLQNDQAAEKMGISYAGVSYLLGELKRRLEVRTRREVLPKALKLGLINP